MGVKKKKEEDNEEIKVKKSVKKETEKNEKTKVDEKQEESDIVSEESKKEDIDQKTQEKLDSIIKKAKEKGKITYGELATELDDANPSEMEKVFDARFSRSRKLKH